MDIVIINSNHLLYDKHSLTFVGAGATAPPVSRVSVVGLSNVFEFLLRKSYPNCDIYSHRDYRLELYPNKGAMHKRWRELRGLV